MSQTRRSLDGIGRVSTQCWPFLLFNHNTEHGSVGRAVLQKSTATNPTPADNANRYLCRGHVQRQQTPSQPRVSNQEVRLLLRELQKWRLLCADALGVQPQALGTEGRGQRSHPPYGPQAPNSRWFRARTRTGPLVDWAPATRFLASEEAGPPPALGLPRSRRAPSTSQHTEPRSPRCQGLLSPAGPVSGEFRNVAMLTYSSPCRREWANPG